MKKHTKTADSGTSNEELQRRLYATDDALVWAKEWCRVAREIEASDDNGEVIDEGWMVGWFANAMQTAVDHHTRKGRRPRLAVWKVTISNPAEEGSMFGPITTEFVLALDIPDALRVVAAEMPEVEVRGVRRWVGPDELVQDTPK